MTKKIDPNNVMWTCGFLLISISTLSLVPYLDLLFIKSVVIVGVLGSIYYTTKVTLGGFLSVSAHILAGLLASVSIVLYLTWIEVLLGTIYYVYVQLQKKNRSRKQVIHIIG